MGQNEWEVRYTKAALKGTDVDSRPIRIKDPSHP